MSLLGGIVGKVTGAVSGAAKAVTGAVNNISKTVSSAVRNGTSLAGSAIKNVSTTASNAVRNGASLAGSAINNISKNAVSLAKNHPAAAAAALIAGTGAAAVSTLSKTSASSAKPVSIPVPDMSISAYYDKLTAAGDTQALSAAVFMGEGRDGTAEVANREVIANTLGVSNAGSTLYKTTYKDGSYEIRDNKGQIVSSGSAGAVYAQTPEEKQKSVNAYQAKNIAKMQERANAGDVAASAWLKTYGNSDSVMNTYSAGKVWAGQTPSTTTVLYSQNGGQSTRPQTSPQQNNDILATISTAFDGFYRTKESMYSKAGAQLDRGDITAAAITAAPTVALDVLAPLGVMQVGNKVISGRLDEISTDELFDAALDIGLIGLGLVTGGAGYVAGKSLKAGVKAMTKTTAKSTAAGAGMLYVDKKVM